MKRIILHAAFVVVASTQLGATNCGQVTRDPGFDLWCGNELCVWKVVRGDVRRVATWHDGDSGVELLGSDTAISQLTPVNSIDGTCIRFDLVANVAETAEVDLNIDVEGDGTVDKQERVPTASWKPVSFRIFVKAPYDGIRFELAKHGTGTAILARINAELADDCEGLAPIAASQRPDGASCGAPEDCASGTCAQLTIFGAPPGSTDGLTCSRCSAGTCGAGETCGYADPLSPVLGGYGDCIPLGSRELGERCVANEECGSGICDVGTCSACVAGTACANGGTCNPSWYADNLFGLPPGPAVCAPGAQQGATGDACGRDGDCASGRCAGSERKQCSDGRPCFDRDNCPIESSLEPGECTTVGVQGGSCQ